MSNIVTFCGCKHLDFRAVYAAKRQQTPMGLFWLRPSERLSMVQFCLLKGRIYGCESCLSKGTAQCLLYEEIVHEIDVPIAELES
jgi:hypothetical protein